MHRSRWLTAAATALLAATTAGCGTLVSALEDDFGPFSGTRLEATAIAGGGSCKTEALMPFIIADLPLSLTADAAVLPVSIPVAVADWLGGRSARRLRPIRRRRPPPRLVAVD